MKFLKILLYASLSLAVVQQHIVGSFTSNSYSDLAVFSKIFGQGTFYKAVYFGVEDNAILTVSGSNALTLVNANDLATSVKSSEVGDRIEITAQSTITGIQATPQLVVTPASGTNVTIDGNVVIRGALSIQSGGDLVINGDLTVIGSVLIGGSATLIVNGNVLFDGNVASPVTITGSSMQVNRSATSNGDVVIRNSAGCTISSSLTADGSVTIENNVGTTAVSITGAVTAGEKLSIIKNVSSGSDGVNITSTVLAVKDILFQDNSSSAATFDGVQLANTVRSTQGGIQCITNSGATTGHGVHISAGTTSCLQGMTLQGNQSTGSGSGVLIAGTVSTPENVLIKDNLSSTGAGINVTGLLEGNQCIFKPTSGTVTLATTGSLTSSGTILGGIVVEGNLTVGTSSTVASDIIVYGDFDMNANLTVQGNLTVFGGGVDIAASTILTVSDDILFDGNNVYNKVAFIYGDIRGASVEDPGANNITFQNYVQGNFVCTVFFVNGNIANVIAQKDIVFQNNRSVGAVADNTVCINGTGKVRSLTGDIIFYKNTTEKNVAVIIEEQLEANRIFFVDNTSTGNSGVSFGVLIQGNGTVTAYKDLYFLRNRSINNTAFGVQLRQALITTNYYRHIFSATNGKNINTDGSYSLSAYYTGTGAGPNTFTRDADEF